MNKILLMLLACTFFTAGAQTIIVSDNSTREPIKDVIIKDKNNKIASTNIKGEASLSELDKSDSLWLYNTGFYPKKIMAANDGTVTRYYLTPRIVTLDEIVFSANRTREKKIDVPYSMEIISQKEIEFANQPTSAEILQNTGAVFIQKSQLGGGSTVLRGFEANKTLLVVDGIRMNNAIYRGGHLQDVITLDANMLDRTEVIFGPSSTMYGSDALGGVMHFYTKNAEFSSDEKMIVKANTFARYSSAANESTGHVDFNLGFKKFASMTNVTYSNFGDLKSGSSKLTGYSKSWDRLYYVERINNRDSMLYNENDNIQIGSAYSQFDIMQRFNIKAGEHLTHNLNFQYSQSGNIPRYDRLTETGTATTTVINPNTGESYKANKMKFAEWYYGPQKRILAAYTLNYGGKTIISDNIRFILAYQKIEQDRFSRRFMNRSRLEQREDLSLYSANLDVNKIIKEKHELRYGAEFTYNNVVSTADSLQVSTGSKTVAPTRYGDDGNKMSSTSVYLSHSWEINDNFIITDGFRFTMNSLESKFKDTSIIRFPFHVAKQNNQAVTGALGFTWKAENDYKVSLLGNTGFRTPNIDDMSKVYDSKGTTVIVPNQNIKPEYAYNVELSISKIFNNNYKFDVTGFYTTLENALVLSEFKFNGSDSATFNGTKSKVYATQNIDRAYIYGVTFGTQLDFNQQISFKGIINYTYGRYVNVKKDTVMPLDHIPPIFGQAGLDYKNKNLNGEFFARFNGAKKSNDYSLNTEDNEIYSADPKNGYMPAWFTLNIRLGYNLTKNIRINAACENITDNRYRVFASGINAPGRNFIVSLRFKM